MTLACGLIIAVIELSAGKGNVSDGQNFGIGCLAVAAMAFFVLLILFYWTKALKDIVARKLRGDSAADNYKGGSELDSESFHINSFRVRPPPCWRPPGLPCPSHLTSCPLAAASAL